MQVVEEEGFNGGGRQAHINYELRDAPGLVPIVFDGLQHYLSILGSLVLLPLVIVPAMGGNDEEKSKVVSTVLFISGVTTLLHTFFGTRLPLIQGPSFVYLAPALAIINSPEFRGLHENSFKHVMKELQGALIISSAFQAILGYTGIMSWFLRLIDLVVVSPTIASIGLSFFSYGITQVGTCIEIGILQILLVIIFSLYLRKIRILGHRIFLIYAVPLTLSITWAVAFLLTESGVGSYHASSLLVASRPPTPGLLSRGIVIEGISSILSALWGTGVGSSTLTENVHTIAVTKMGSRRAVELGAVILIFVSLIRDCYMKMQCIEHASREKYTPY